MEREEPEIHVDELTPDVAVVAVIGEHDLSTAGRLNEIMRRLMAEGFGIVVDLTACTFIDSSIIAVLLGAAGREPRLLAQLGAGSPVRRALEIVSADRVLCMSAAGPRRSRCSTARDPRAGAEGGSHPRRLA